MAFTILNGDYTKNGESVLFALLSGFIRSLVLHGGYCIGVKLERDGLHGQMSTYM
jgi:hypothetical protein